MTLVQALILGLLQGATEFLPVSSSGHLVLIPWLLHWESPGLAFDTLVHLATALAVVGYFRHDWLALVRAGWGILRTRTARSTEERLVLLIVAGTLPAAAIGFLLNDVFEQMFARPAAAAAFLILTAAILATAERFSRRRRELNTLSWQDALVVGAAQALAILPGVSRSGSTIAAGMGKGLERESAARFSFLLATPIIVGAGLFQLVDLAQVDPANLALAPLLVGCVSALASGLACIHLLLRYLRRRPLYPFAIYCAAAGVVCLTIALLRAYG
jgi:undecaprenyl-diphosphatase